MRGRLIFDGYLAHDTADRIAEGMRTVLDGQLYTFVTANELFDYRPEVRVNLDIREPIDVRTPDGSDHTCVRFNDQNYVCSISTTARTENAAQKLPEKSCDRVHVVITTAHVQIRQCTPAGSRLWWTLTPTGPIPAGVPA